MRSMGLSCDCTGELVQVEIAAVGVGAGRLNGWRVDGFALCGLPGFDIGEVTAFDNGFGGNMGGNGGGGDVTIAKPSGGAAGGL